MGIVRPFSYVASRQHLCSHFTVHTESPFPMRPRSVNADCPLEAHLSRAVGQQGAETQLRLFCTF
jgi:hypothetical protein